MSIPRSIKGDETHIELKGTEWNGIDVIENSQETVDAAHTFLLAAVVASSLNSPFFVALIVHM